MSARKIQDTLGSIERTMHILAPYRRPELFNSFLVQGYSAIALSCVPEARRQDLLRAKVCVGTLITLYDDYADRPSRLSTTLLSKLYRLKFEESETPTHLSLTEQGPFDFAQFLFGEIRAILQDMPFYSQLKEVLDFDLSQFYSANQFSSLVTGHPFLNSTYENRMYGHHNMGMVLVGTMDLMASNQIDFAEFGRIREVLLMGQRMGRIFNVLTTRKREVADGDITGEISGVQNELEIEKAIGRLEEEVSKLEEAILTFETRIRTFSVKSYLEGLQKVGHIHSRMEGII